MLLPEQGRILIAHPIPHKQRKEKFQVGKIYGSTSRYLLHFEVKKHTNP